MSLEFGYETGFSYEGMFFAVKLYTSFITDAIWMNTMWAVFLWQGTEVLKAV